MLTDLISLKSQSGGCDISSHPCQEYLQSHVNLPHVNVLHRITSVIILKSMFYRSNYYSSQMSQGVVKCRAILPFERFDVPDCSCLKLAGLIYSLALWRLQIFRAGYFLNREINFWQLTSLSYKAILSQQGQKKITHNSLERVLATHQLGCWSHQTTGSCTKRTVKTTSYPRPWNYSTLKLL